MYFIKRKWKRKLCVHFAFQPRFCLFISFKTRFYFNTWTTLFVANEIICYITNLQSVAFVMFETPVSAKFPFICSMHFSGIRILIWLRIVIPIVVAHFASWIKIIPTRLSQCTLHPSKHFINHHMLLMGWTAGRPFFTFTGRIVEHNKNLNLCHLCLTDVVRKK